MLGELSLGIVLYDGDCGVCRKTISAFQRAQWARAFEFAPYQALSEERLRMLGTSAQACAGAIQLCKAGASTVWGADAMLELLANYGGVTRFLALICAGTPFLRAFARLVYGAFAARRARISVMLGLTACEIQKTRDPG